MRKVRNNYVTTRLTDSENEDLNTLSIHYEMSRSDVLRLLLNKEYKQFEKKAVEKWKAKKITKK